VKNPFSRRARRRPAPHLHRTCPYCGSPLPPKALACPECGSDENTGWKSEEDIEFEALDLGDPPHAGLSRTWRIVILIVALLFLLSYGLLFTL